MAALMIFLMTGSRAMNQFLAPRTSLVLGQEVTCQEVALDLMTAGTLEVAQGHLGTTTGVAQGQEEEAVLGMVLEIDIYHMTPATPQVPPDQNAGLTVSLYTEGIQGVHPGQGTASHNIVMRVLERASQKARPDAATSQEVIPGTLNHQDLLFLMGHQPHRPLGQTLSGSLQLKPPPASSVAPEVHPSQETESVGHLICLVMKMAIAVQNMAMIQTKIQGQLTE